MSVAWAYTFMAGLCYWTFLAVFGVKQHGASFGNPIPYWRGGAIAVACLIQLMTGILLDKSLKGGALRTYFFSIWFPVIYWFLHFVAAVIATPQGLFRKFNKPVVWTSPER